MGDAGKRRLAAAASLALLLLAHLWLWLLPWAAAVGGTWVVRLRRHPWRPCRSCRGTGKNRGSEDRQRGDCPRCTTGRPGTRRGEELRFGARWARPDLW